MATITTPRDKAHWLELRSRNINSTDVSSLFGVNPYCTEFELWHRLKEGAIHTIEENDRMFIGSGLETAIANMAATREGWQIRPLKDYYSVDESRLGASFDFQIVKSLEATHIPISFKNAMTGEDMNVAYTSEYVEQVGLVEIKNVDYLQYKKNWIEHSPEDIEAPPHIELQVQAQLLVSGLSTAYLCALVGGNDLKIIRREANKAVQDAILARVKNFWSSIESGTAPKINYEADADFLISLHKYAEPNSVLSLEGDTTMQELVHKYAECTKEANAVEARKKAIKAQLLELVGEYEKVKHPLFSISAGVRAPVEVEAHTRAGFRDFRVFLKGAV